MSFAKETESYGNGSLSAIGQLADTELLKQLRHYKRIIAKRYRVIPSDKCEEILPEGQLWISTKLDGQLWFFIARNGSYALCSYNGRVLENIPLIDSIAQKLGSNDVIIAGELYCTSKEGRPRVQHISTALGDEKRADDILFKAFDLVEDNEQDGLTLPYEQRLSRIHDLLDEQHIVETQVVERDKAPELYREWVLSEQHEGLIARSEHGITYKIKPLLTLDLVVVAFGARINGGTHELRELSLALIDDDGNYQIVGTVGTGFSDEDRLTWHNRLSKLIVDSSFRMANSEGTLCHFVKPEVVVEVKCSDLLTHDGRDHCLRRMRLSVNDQGYTPLGEYHTAVMLHPRFSRERDDKIADSANVGLEQILSRVSLDSDQTQNAIDLPQAEIVERAVWVKETKGKKAVRKYTLIKTNKEEHSDISPFVLYSTDFSAGRAEPLKTTLNIASTKELADKQIESWKTANIKKGWKEA